MYFLRTNTFKIILVALLLSLSLVYNHNIDFWIIKEYVYYKLFLTLAISTILFFTSKEPLQFGKVDVVVIFIFILLAISRGLRLNSLNEFHIINTFALIIYYISLKTIRLKKEEVLIYYQIIIGIGILLSIYCFLELSDNIDRTSIYWSMKGNFPNPGPLGGFIAIILSVTFYQLLQKDILKTPVKLVFYILAVLMMLFVLFESASRAAMLSLVISITFLASYYGFKKWKNFKYLLISLLPILISIVLSKGTDSIHGRLLIWKITFLSFLDHPLTGIGYNFFGAEYINLQADYFSKGGTMKEILLAGSNSQAFNEFLKFAIENGLLGIILIAIAGIWVFKSQSFAAHFPKESFFLTSIGVYISFIVFSFFSFPLQFLPFKLLLINQIALQNYSSFPYRIKINKNYKKIAFSLVVGLLLFTVTQQYNGFRAWKNASELEYTNPDSSKTLYEYAEKSLNNDGNFLLRYGNFLEDKDIDTALSLYEKAKKINNLPILYAKTANLYEKKQNYKSAEINLLKLHFIQPHLFNPQEKLLEFYIRNGNLKNARFYANEILKTPIKIKSKEVSFIKLKAKKYLINSIY